jgi:hypothetical protein
MLLRGIPEPHPGKSHHCQQNEHIWKGTSRALPDLSLPLRYQITFMRLDRVRYRPF